MFLAWGKELLLEDFPEIPRSHTFKLILCLTFHDSNSINSENIPKHEPYSTDVLAFSSTRW